MTHLKILTAPLIALTTLALLTACGGGGVAITNNIGEININNGTTCTDNPFATGCTTTLAEQEVFCRDVTRTTDNKTTDCAPTVMRVCTENPYEADLCLNNNDYVAARATIRATCSSADDAVRDALCPVIVTEDCTDDPFLPECLVGADGAGKYKTDRDEEISTICPDNPFEAVICFIDDTYESQRETQTLNCRNEVADAPNCVIAKAAVCDANIFDDFCMGLPDLATMRETACQTHGTGMGGDDSCATSLITACGIANPFAHAGCDDVVNIDAEIRTTFCQTPANAFKTGCKDGTHGAVDAARDTACLEGLPTATGCDARVNVGTMCMSMPLRANNPGCADLPNYRMLLGTYCAVGNRATEVGACGTTVAAVCPTDAFNPSAVILGGGTVNCLMNADYAPARRMACATETETSRCDTMEIAPEVCKDSGASANPFAVFCETATNIGGDKTVAEIRQSALDACPDSTKDTDGGICQNTIMTRATLAMDCALAGAFEPRCDYTQYEPQKTMYCEAEATTWNVLCDGETIGTTTAQRDAACLANADADMANTGSDTRCGARSGVAAACGIANPFAHVGCDNVVNIDSGVRTTYCTMQANAFKTGCKTDGTHDVLTENGTTVNDARLLACLFSPVGDPANPLCETDSLVEEGCGLDPFNATNTGCRNLMRFQEIVGTYCTTTMPNADECKVKTSDWVASFGEGKAPPARLDNTVTTKTDRQRQFLTGLATVTNGEGLDDTGATAATHYSLTLKSAMYNGEPLGGAGDEKDGYGFFFDTVATNNNVLYAGLLSDTDLGAPLTQTDGSVTWYGQIQIFRGGSNDTRTTHDFTLEITFGTNPAVADSVGSIEGFVERILSPDTIQYRLAGTYDAGGVITGTTTQVGFIGEDIGQLAAEDTPNGILTGLIGAQGAVGVFISGNNVGAVNGSTKDNIKGDANSTSAYVGGFIVAPYVSAEEDDARKVTFRDWLRGFDYPLHTSAAVADARTTAPSHFIKPKAGEMLADNERLDITGVTLATVYPVSRAGDDKDGFVYTAGTIDGRTNSFVGILPSTDLGAPLTNPIETKWSGQFSLTDSATLNDIEFTITFDGTNSGTINGTAEVLGSDLIFALMFDGKGIITGDAISRANFLSGTAEARGLIGEEGLVGVFANINGGPSAWRLFGGFVASPPVANYDAWLGDFSRTLSTTLSTGGALFTKDRPRQFLAGGETELDPDDSIRDPISIGLTFNSAMYDGEALSGNNDARDGFAGFADVVFVTGLGANANVIYYAGLLSGTDLGAPLTDTTGSATLFGQIQILRFDAIDTNSNEDFELKITFGGTGGVAGSIEGFAQSLNTANGYHLAGTYDTGGIITGTVTFASFTGSLDDGNLTTTTDPNGILTGLIGEHGAVGVFIAADKVGELDGSTKEVIIGSSSNANAYAGGFVAAPPPSSVATYANFKTYYADLARVDGRTLYATPTASTSFAAFVEGTATSLPTDDLTFTGTNNFAPIVFKFGGAVEGDSGFDDIDDGFVLMYGVSSGSNTARAGLLSGTDLGLALDNTVSTSWSGTARVSNNLANGIPIAIPITLEVNFSDGEINTTESFSGTSSSVLDIKGRFGGGLPAGILGGTVDYRTSSGSSRISMNLIGLIGTKGALGVFHGGVFTVVGGFQASPN